MNLSSIILAAGKEGAPIDLTLYLLIGAGVVVFIILIIFAVYFKTWIQAMLADAYISFFHMISMTLRRVPVGLIVRARIKAVQEGVNITYRDLESYYLGGGDVPRVVEALIRAKNANINLTINRAKEINRTGRDLLDAVSMSIYPKVIDCPDATRGVPMIAAVAKDGIQLQAKARVTVRTQIDRLVGGATEETVIARVGEGIVSAIGSSESYKEVLENPDKISKSVLAKGLDSGTAFEILSIDIADVDVGENIGAKLQKDQALTDKEIAQARAEGKAAMARAQEQENRATIRAARAKVVLAEAEIPKAIADAFREGKLGIMDYMRYKNIMADTQMRESIGGSDKKTDEE
jgi:uncharacterized protein YqfA (UPF0365 family)